MTQINKHERKSGTTSQECCADLGTCLSPDLFKALGDPNRIAILARLAHGGGEQTVGQVASCCPIDLSVVSRHLRILRDAGALEANKRGKEVFYQIRVRELVTLLRGLADALEACCGSQSPEGESQ